MWGFSGQEEDEEGEGQAEGEPPRHLKPEAAAGGRWIEREEAPQSAGVPPALVPVVVVVVVDADDPEALPACSLVGGARALLGRVVEEGGGVVGPAGGGVAGEGEAGVSYGIGGAGGVDVVVLRAERGREVEGGGGGGGVGAAVGVGGGGGALHVVEDAWGGSLEQGFLLFRHGRSMSELARLRA